MSKRSKLLVTIILSFVVLILSVGVLLYFLITEDRKTTNENNNTETIITDEKYTDENKLLMSNAIKEFLSIDENFVGEPWFKEFIDKTIAAIPDAFEKAGIDIKIYSNLVSYIDDLKTNLSQLNFDFTGIIDGDNISLAEIMQVFGKMENVNAMYNIFNDFYASGITNLELGRILYYFLRAEVAIIDEYSVDIIKHINVDGASEEVQTLLYGVLIDVSTILNDNFDSIPVDDFAVSTASLLDFVSKSIELYKKFNIYTIVELFENIRDGNITASELETLVQNAKIDLIDMLDPDTGKFITIPQEAYKTVFSIATKIPIITELLKLSGVTIPEEFNISDYLTPVLKVIPQLENLINRFFHGIINILDKIENTTKLNIVGPDGEQYIKTTTMAQAIIDNISEIAKDDEIVVNSDTFIIFAKILNGMFETNALNINYIDSFMSDITPVMNIIIELVNSEETTLTSELINGYISNFKTVVTTISIVANQDLGTSDDKLLEKAPQLLVVFDNLETFLTAVFNNDYFTAQQVVIGAVIFLLIPVFVVELPAFIATLPITMVFALPFLTLGVGTVTTYVVAILLEIVLSGSSGADFNFEQIFAYDFLLNFVKDTLLEGYDITAENYIELISQITNLGATFIVEWFRGQLGWQTPTNI